MLKLNYKEFTNSTPGMLNVRFRVMCIALSTLLFIPDSFAQSEYEPNQPYSSYWFVDQFLQWDPEKDPHAKFNISHVALQERFVDTNTQIRPELSVKPSITSLIPTHPTSNHPSQGFRSIEQYVFPYWQYIDYFVQWGGSAGEGLILTPTAPWIEAAHRNGVQVLGTFFFPPNVYGGKEEWVREFLQKDDMGNFPVADKMIEVAEYYGFEGWFINQETNGLNKQDADDMQAFLRYFQQKAPTGIKIMWYDAMIEDGRVIWQDEFNHHNATFFQQDQEKLSDIMFIDFGWSITDLEDSRVEVQKLGRSTWDLYAGINVASRSYKSYVSWKALYKDDKPYTTSIGLFCPNSTFNIAKDKQPESVYKEEQKFWNGTVLEEDVPAWRSKEWKGFANYFPARSTLAELPFVTNFNYGLGRFYNEKGKRLSDDEWHNMGNQDILPTWQWQVDTTKLTATFDFNESYTGGSSVRLDFVQDNVEAIIPLYKTNFTLSGNEKVELVAKGKGRLTLTLDFSNGERNDYVVKVTENWQTFAFKVQGYTSEKIVKIGLKAAGNVNDFIHLGHLTVRENSRVKIGKPVLSYESFTNGDKAEIYLHIDGDKNSRYHSVYHINRDGSKKWLGQTNSSDYYIAMPKQKSNNAYTNIEVVSVAADGSRSRPGATRIHWK